MTFDFQLGPHRERLDRKLMISSPKQLTNYLLGYLSLSPLILQSGLNTQNVEISPHFSQQSVINRTFSDRSNIKT